MSFVVYLIKCHSEALVLSLSSSVQDGFRDAGVLVQGQERDGVGEEIDLQQNSVHQVFSVQMLFLCLGPRD